LGRLELDFIVFSRILARPYRTLGDGPEKIFPHP